MAKDVGAPLTSPIADLGGGLRREASEANASG